MTGDLYTNLLREEALEAEDICRLQTLYPATAKQIRQQVEQECDRMEYAGSRMFDEMPDAVMVSRQAGEIAAMAGADQEPWGEDMARVLLVDEMHRRRSRYRRHRSWREYSW